MDRKGVQEGPKSCPKAVQVPLHSQEARTSNCDDPTTFSKGFAGLAGQFEGPGGVQVALGSQFERPSGAQEAPNMGPDASKIELGEPQNKFVRDASFFRMFFDMLLYFLIFV